MMFIISTLILFIFLIFIFIPIPLKFKVQYKDKSLDIYIYNININDKLYSLKKKTNHRVDVKEDQIPLFTDNLKVALNSLKAIKFKPTLKLDVYSLYGVENAGYTAMIYGLITTLNPLILQLLKIVFNVKSYNVTVKPDFNKWLLRLEINSIIYLSLAKIIYIVFIIYKNRRKYIKLKPMNT